MQNNEIPLYVTDTHSLIWYLTDSPKLSLNASKGFKEIWATYHITGTSREFEMVLSIVTRGTGSLSSSDR